MKIVLAQLSNQRPYLLQVSTGGRVDLAEWSGQLLQFVFVVVMGGVVYHSYSTDAQLKIGPTSTTASTSA